MKFILTIFWGLAGLCIVFLLGLLVLPGFVDWNRHKPLIEARLTALAGRAVTIGGDIGFYALPLPNIRVEKMRVAGGSQARGGPLLWVEAGEARLALASLAQGSIDVTHLELIKPTLTLEVYDKDNSFGRIEGFLEDLLSRPHGFFGPRSIGLDSVAVEGGIVRVIDYQSNRFLAVHGINAHMEMDSLLGPFKAKGTLIYKGSPLRFNVSFGRFGRAQGVSVALELSREGLRGHFAGVVSPEPRAEGTLRVWAESVGDLVEQDIPYPVRLESKILGSPQGVELRDLEFVLGPVTTRGTLRWAGSQHPIKIQLSSRGADLDRLLNRKGVILVDIPVGLRHLGGALETYPLWVEFNLAVDSLLYGGDVVEEIRLSGEIRQGQLAHIAATARLPGGAEYTLQGHKEESVFRGRVSLEAHALKDLMAWGLGAGFQELLAVPEGVYTRMALESAFVAEQTRLQLEDVKGHLDGISIMGSLSYQETAPMPLRVTAHLGKIQGDRYAPYLGVIRWGGPSAEVRLTAQSISFGPHTAHSVQAQLLLEHGTSYLLHLQVEDFLGATFSLEGNMGLGASWTGDLQGNLKARAPEVFLAFLDAGLSERQRRLMRPLEIRGRLSIEDTKTAALSLEGKLGDSQIHLQGTLSPFVSFREGFLDGRLTVETPQGRLLVHQLGLPEALGGSGKGHLTVSLKGPLDAFLKTQTLLRVGDVKHSLKGEARLIADELHWRGMQGEVAGVTFTTDGRAVTTLHRTSLKGSLHVDAVPYALVSWLRKVSSRGETFNFSFLQDFDAQVRVQAKTLALRLASVKALEMDLSLSAGRLRLEQVKASVAGGTLEATADLSTTRFSSAGSLRLALKDVVLSPFSVVKGRGDITLFLEGAGGSPPVFLSSLSGKGRVMMREGQVQGYNFSTFARGLAEVSGDYQLDMLLMQTEQGNTPFKRMGGDFTVSEGIFSLTGGVFESAAGSGDLNIFVDAGRKRLDAELIFKARGQPLSLVVAGSLDRPFISLDATLLRASLSAAIR